MDTKLITPVIGEGATEAVGSDRYAYTVIDIWDKGKSCSIRSCSSIRTDNNGISEDQKYRYEENPNAPLVELRFSRNKWRRVMKNFVFTDEWKDKSHAEKNATGIWENDECWDKLVKDGVIKLEKSYPVIRISFGVRRAYSDPCF